MTNANSTLSFPINKGWVYLVGAGPGDPGLMTVKGLELTSQADTIVYDHLVTEEIRALFPARAKLYYVGKKAGKHTVEQDGIQRILVEEAKKGNAVVRLKGGDPFIFGRGGEECVALAEAGVRFEVVPGVSAAAAVPAYAGIPLTYRNLSTHFVVATGHESASKQTPDVDWQAVAKLGGTLVIFMGMLKLRHIADQLIRYGRDPSTPAAAIRWGATPMQQTAEGRLDTIADITEGVGMRPPALIVIGEVAALRGKIRWFGENPDSAAGNDESP